MSRDLRDVSRDFGLGNATLEDLREAAQAERIHRQAADQILKLITAWENSAWSRNELRMRVRQLTPPPPQSPRGATFYDAGLKAKRRSRQYSSALIAYVLANWKMYPAPDEAIALVARAQERLRQESTSTPLPIVIVCPPVIALMPMRDIVDRRVLRLGAQNCHWESSGAYTGEISAAMLKGLVDYVMVGHSERRRTGETDEQIASKVAAIAAHEMTPILFVGEDEPTDAAAEQTEERLERGLAEVDVARSPVLLVYEPTWAIGTDEPAEADHVRAVVARLKERLGEKGVQRPQVIYGGTVNADNVGQFTAIDVLDGVGSTRGTLDEDGFVAIVQAVAGATSEADPR